MVKKRMIKVKTIGKLGIINKKSEFPREKMRSMQVELLLIYLILNRNSTFDNQQLIELLWPDGDIDKPEGALRNLIYRARKEMKFLFDDVLDCIKSKGHSYSWNNEIMCQVDYEMIIKICHKINKETDVFKQYQRCLDLLDLYTGRILPGFDSKWIVELNNSLNSIIIETLNHCLQKLSDHNMFKEVIDLCKHNNMVYFDDMKIYEFQLYAYYRSGKLEEAMSFFHWCVDLYYRRYCLKVSARLKEIHQMILNEVPTLPLDIDEFERKLNYESQLDEPQYVDYDIFRSIYQYNHRNIKQNDDIYGLVLLTLIDKSNQLDKLEIKQGTNLLQEIIKNRLGKNDVYSQINQQQYVLMIQVVSFRELQKLLKRLINSFEHKNGLTELVLASNYKLIE